MPFQSTTFRISGLEPAQVPQKFGANYVYTWTVEDGTASGSGADGALVIDFAGSTSIEKKITVSVGTDKDDQRVDFSETEEFKISALADFGSDFNTAGQFAPFTADYKLVWKNWSFGYKWDLETGSEYHNESNPLTSDTWYTYLGTQKELIVSAADGSFVMCDTSTDTNVAGMGDAAETAVSLNGPEFNVVGGVTYKVSARIYRAADSKADVFVTVGSKEALVPTAEGWHDIEFDYTPASDTQTSLKVWKMPVGVRDWSAITGGEDGNLKTGSDTKGVKVDSISIRYADKADEPSEA